MSNEQLSVFLAMAVKPFILVVGLVALYYVRVAIEKWLKPGKLKNILLMKV